MHRSQRKYTPENVQLALTRLRIMGNEIPTLYTHDGNNSRWGYYRFDEAPEEMQKRFWVRLMHYSRGKLEKW